MESKSLAVDGTDLGDPGLDRSAESPNVDLGPDREPDHFVDAAGVKGDDGSFEPFPTPASPVEFVGPDVREA
jgi:hypothetical protein